MTPKKIPLIPKNYREYKDLPYIMRFIYSALLVFILGGACLGIVYAVITGYVAATERDGHRIVLSLIMVSLALAAITTVFEMVGDFNRRSS